MGVLPTGDAVRKEMLLVVDRRLIECAVEEVGEEVGEAGVEEFVCVGTRILKGTIPTATISTVSGTTRSLRSHYRWSNRCSTILDPF